MSKNYAVRRIIELTRLSETGVPERYYRHQIVTKGGVVLTVNIGEDDFTPERARPILEAKAAEADAILSS